MAQITVEKSLTVGSGQAIEMDFTYAKTVRIYGGTNDEIHAKAHVRINNGANNDAYELELVKEGSTVRLTSGIRDYRELPQKITIRYDGVDYFFDTDDWQDSKIQEFLTEKGKENVSWNSKGVQTEIEVEVTIPLNSSIFVKAKFGMVEITNFAGEMIVDAKHGGIDLSVPGSTNNRFEFHTSFGEIYTDLPFAISPKESKGFKMDIDASLNGGEGSLIQLTSAHGNIYLRQSK